MIGGSRCCKKYHKVAREFGRLVAKEGWVLICGGGQGVMGAASLGAKEEGGLVVGILPSSDGAEANKYLSVKIPTGLGFARNILVVRASDVVVAIDGKHGTLSEIAFALNENKKIYGLDTWDIKGVIKTKTPQEVIKKIKRFKNAK